MPGAEGICHGANYVIANPEWACVGSAKWQLGMITLLLQNGGERARKIADEFVPPFASFEDYFKYIDSLECRGDRITYNEDKTSASIKL